MGLHLFDAKSGKKSAKANKIRQALDNQQEIVEEIIATTESEKYAFELEVLLIQKYGRKDIGTGILCNHTDGGEGAVGRELSKDHKRKISEANKGQIRDKNRPDQCKAITSYTLDGKVLESFPSAREAERKYGINHKKIYNALTGRAKAAKVINKQEYYQFRYGMNNENIEPVSIGRWSQKKNK